MKVFFASDHAGFELKGKLIAHVKELGYEIEDLGAHSFDEEDDYSDFVTPLAERIASEPDGRGVVIGRSGQGEAMCANRIRGVRAAVFYGGSSEIIQLAREHNNANILSLGAQFISFEEAKDAVKNFIQLPFSDSPRHSRRLAKF